MRPALRRTLAALVAALGTTGLVATIASGCALDFEEELPDDETFLDTGGDGRVQGVEVGDDADRVLDLCGERNCDPDFAFICTPLVKEAGPPGSDAATSADSAVADAAPKDAGSDAKSDGDGDVKSDAADGSADGSADVIGDVLGDAKLDATLDALGDVTLDAVADATVDAQDSGAATDTRPPPESDALVPDGAGPTTNACRVVHRDDTILSACAPAGKIAEGEFCANDDGCAPGLACVGEPGLGRCFRYCCAVWTDKTLVPDAGGGTHYCTPRPLAARPLDKVPVWVKLDNCTLLEDQAQCPEGTTCTVVTNDGKTTCVPAGSGRDYASCAEEPCDRGYVCLGSSDRRCRKLCDEKDPSCPGGAHCQRVPTIPTGYGICSGGGG